MVKRTLPKYNGPRETKLKKLLDEKTIEENEAQRAHRKNKARSLYASDFGQCMRKVWFQFFPDIYPKPEYDPRVIRIFQNGDAVHDRLGTYLRRANIDFEEEIDVPRDDLDVHGRCDGIAKVDERPVVIEFKSINRKKVYKAKPEHIGQLTWYMAMWRMLREELRDEFNIPDGQPADESDLRKPSKQGRTFDDLDRFERWLLLSFGEIEGEIIYESKQIQQTYHFPVQWNDDEYRKVRTWFEQLDWHVENEVRPIVDYEKNKFPCSWGKGDSAGKCPYYDECYDG